MYWRLATSDECRVPEWEGLRAFLEEISARTHTTPAVFVRVANKGVAGYGTWKSIRNSGGRREGVHPRDDGKSAQRIDSQRVAKRPWRKRVRKNVKRKGIDGGTV